MQEQQTNQPQNRTPHGTGAGVSAPAAAAGGPVSEDLVRKVAERVYVLLMAELRLDFERQRIAAPGRRGERRRRGVR